MEINDANRRFKEEYTNVGFELFEENNDGFIFLVPPFPWSRNPNSVQLYILDIKQYVNNINNLMSNYLIINDNCGIISKDYREQLINIKTSGKYGIYPPKEMGRTSIILQLAFCEGLYPNIFDLNVPYVGFPSKLRPIFSVLSSNLNTFLDFSTANAKPPLC